MEPMAIAGVLSMEQMLGRLQEWAIAHTPNALRIMLIALAAAALSKLFRKLIARIERVGEKDEQFVLSGHHKRVRTVGRILQQGVTVLVWSLAGMSILSELGLDLKPILAGAGIAGLAVGFGAQTLVKDLIHGFFILLENQFRVNDTIRTAGVEGSVEAINLRTTVLRDAEGRVHVIPNGSIDVVTNLTRRGSRAVLDVAVAYGVDIDRCLEVLREVGDEMAKDPLYRSKLVGAFEYPGVEKLGDSSIVLRLSVETLPHERLKVLRELRRRIKKAFDAAGIATVTPPPIVHIREGGAEVPH